MKSKSLTKFEFRKNNPNRIVFPSDEGMLDTLYVLQQYLAGLQVEVAKGVKKAALQCTANLIKDWVQIEKEFVALVTKNVHFPGNGEWEVNWQPFNALTVDAYTVLFDYSNFLVEVGALRPDDQAAFNNMLSSCGLAAIWHFMSILKMAIGQTTGDLQLTTTNMQSQLSDLRITLPQNIVQYVNEQILRDERLLLENMKES